MFQLIDIFPIPFTLKYKCVNIIKTTYGSIFSIFAIIGILFSVFYFGQNLYLKLNPTVFSKISQNTNFTLLNFTNTTD